MQLCSPQVLPQVQSEKGEGLEVDAGVSDGDGKHDGKHESIDLAAH